MRILFHCWEYPPVGAGIGSYIYHMSAGLRALGCYTVIVTSYRDAHATVEEMPNGVVYRSYPRSAVGSKWIDELILEKVRAHRIDWIEGADHLGESACLLARADRPPVVIKTHYNAVIRRLRYCQAFFPWQKPLINLACLRTAQIRQREKRSLAGADVLLAPCRRILEEVRGQGLPVVSRHAVIPNPVAEVSGWENEEATCPTLLLVGRIDMGKGIGFIPAMLKQLLPVYPELKLEIAGGDGYARFMGSMKKWLSVQLGDMLRSVDFLGHVDALSLDAAYRRAWVQIVPSIWDTFPTVVLEGMARAKPLVVSPHGGMPEMIEGTANYVADPSKTDFSRTVAELLGDQALRRQAGISGQQKAKTVYDCATVASNYLKYLESVL